MIKEVIIEIGKNSDIKYEIDPDGKLRVDRILYGSNRYPQNYGFIDNTLDWDGDPLDVLVIANHSFLPTTIVETKILGAMRMIDGGETDTKLIGVIANDIRFSHINKLEDVPQALLNEIEDFFKNYKNLQNKRVEVNGFLGVEAAQKELEETQKLYEKYKDMNKDDFITLMKKEHPEKYS